MLALPSDGFQQSAKKHNGDLAKYADWIEASVVFTASDVTRSDIIDAICSEAQLYSSQDFAHKWIDMVFKELIRRKKLLGPACVWEIDGNRVKKTRDWTECPAHAFCLALSIVPQYRLKIESAVGKDYTKQGRLFESLCLESLQASNWHAVSVGWSHAATSKLEEKVQALASELGEVATPGAVSKWTEPTAKDAGLDIVAHLAHRDGWAGRPICLIQCASGEDWPRKLHTPNVETWKKLVDFATSPLRGLMMPFAPEESVFRKRANTDLVMLLYDRHRILSPTKQDSAFTPTTKLATDLLKWTKPRIAAFPLDNR